MSLIWIGFIDMPAQLQSSASQGNITSVGHHAFTTSATSEGIATSGGGLVFSGGSYFPFGGAAPINLTAVGQKGSIKLQMCIGCAVTE